MSVIKSYDSPLFGKLNVEFYRSAIDMEEDLQKRCRTSDQFKADEYNSYSFVGATREEAHKMLRTGYQPIVDEMKGKIKILGKQNRFKSVNDVTGYAPVVKSMVDTRIKQIKTKVIDVYYDMTVSCMTDSDDIIKAGSKMLGVILAMEAQGYRFNLYVVQCYYDKEKGGDMLCVKVKSANQIFDLKRMSFPVAHTAFFRGIGFEWYSKFPLGRYRDGYGHSIFYDEDHETIQNEYKRLFGENAFCFSARDIINEEDKADEYIMKILTGLTIRKPKEQEEDEEEPEDKQGSLGEFFRKYPHFPPVPF